MNQSYTKTHDELLPCIYHNDCDGFVLKYMDFIYYIVLKFKSSISESEVEDYVHEVFVQLLKNNREKLHKYDPTKGLSLRSWINLIATQTIINELRRKKRNPLLIITHENDNALDLLTNIQPASPNNDSLITQIEDIIETLPNRYRLFFKLYYLRNMNLDEIADFLKTNKDNVYSLKYKAIKYLKKKIIKTKR